MIFAKMEFAIFLLTCHMRKLYVLLHLTYFASIARGERRVLQLEEG